MTVDVGGKASKVVIKLRPDLAPKHVANFQKQANSGFYDGIAVHRAIRSYLVQTGDPLTRDEGQKINWGTGGSEKKIPAEIKGKHVKGAVAMARLNDSLNPDKSSSSSQFYIMLRGASSLDSGYTVFGEVVSGLDVVEQISSQVVDTNDVPLKRVEVQSIRLIPPTAKELSEPAKKTRGQTQTENDKGPFTKFIERIW
jgi:cyclophilin family peptidyl-prolyl cis-trans isomerase